jgi:hypothetical protein
MKFKQWLRAFLGINDDRNAARFEEIMLAVGAVSETLQRIDAALTYRPLIRRRVPDGIMNPQTWEEVQAEAMRLLQDDLQKGN